MTQFSASDAALEGFHLIRRRWRVILGWAGFNLLALVMLVVLTVLASFVASAVSDGARTPVAAVGGAVAGLGGLLVQAILAAGVFRLDLRPEEPAFMHLRLGRDELRLVVVWLITLTGAWTIGWAAAMLGHAVGVGVVWDELLAFGLVVYLGMRFLLAAPISFVERRIDFPRSWRLSRGRVTALLGMSVLSFSLIVLVMIVVFVALGLIAMGAAGFEGLASVFTESSEAFQEHPGLFILEFVVEIVLAPVLWTLAMAPLAAAYRAFTAAEAAPGPDPAR
jgi:hypothetical protein